MPNYVLVLCRSYNDNFILVEKDRPAWQKGWLNLPGGKIEENENPREAVFRELQEETGIAEGQLHYMTLCGILLDKESKIYCYVCGSLDEDSTRLKPQQQETEVAQWFNWETATQDDRLMPNLRLIIPLLMMKQRGWTIEDNDGGVDKSKHTVQITLPGGQKGDQHDL